MSSLGFGALLAIFVAAGAATWVAGGYLSRATDVLDDRFNLGEAVGGMLLLGLAGSLPELAITASAALSGHLALATGNLLGGIAMQTLVLVLLDAASGRPRPLSALVANTSPLNQAGLMIGLVTLAIMGDPPRVDRDRPRQPDVAGDRRVLPARHGCDQPGSSGACGLEGRRRDPAQKCSGREPLRELVHPGGTRRVRARLDRD